MDKNSDKINSIRHSLAHILAMAVLKKFPKAKLGIGPVIENGFYYDFRISNKHKREHESAQITEKDLPEIESIMRELIKQKLDFSGERVTPQKAKKCFKDQPFKLDLIKDLVKEKKELIVYYTCPSDVKGPRPRPSSAEGGQVSNVKCFVDLCRGGHVANTSEINSEGFKLTHVAGAYWKGGEKKPMLTRVYGVAFESKQELDQHLTQLEEAKKRDHKKLGVELDLFTFSDLVGPGLPLWTPKGTLLRDILDEFVWRLRKEKGYLRVDIPHIAKKELYEKSGHWDKFKDELFKIETREGHIFAMKPMNCPHHIQIYARKPWSYRELPQRYASTTKVYRDEQTGELSGLSRVRSITQDDAHVFTRHSQIKEEILKIWGIVIEFYKTAGFSLTPRLSLSDPNEQEKYLGTRDTWESAEKTLRDIIAEKKETLVEAVGEAAFYGPKIDFLAKDSLGRQWQVATIQLDMNLPERFDLSCVNEKGEKERIVMIHAAIMGSIERYLSILIEHFAGAFPFWLAPIQVQILTVNDSIGEYAKVVLKKLESEGVRVSLDERNETIGKKIREGELQKIPYLLIVGPKEKDAQTVAVRAHGKGDEGALSLEEFFTRIDTEKK